MKFSRRTVLKLPAATLAVRAIAARRRFIIDGHQHWGELPTYVDNLAKEYQPRNAMACENAYMINWERLESAVRRYPDTIAPHGRIFSDISEWVAEIDQRLYFHVTGSTLMKKVRGRVACRCDDISAIAELDGMRSQPRGSECRYSCRLRTWPSRCVWRSPLSTPAEKSHSTKRLKIWCPFEVQEES